MNETAELTLSLHTILIIEDEAPIAAAVAARLATEARELIALCPLSIAVHAQADAPREVRIAYRPPAIDTPGGKAARELMARIVARAAALVGRD